jgi:hypothetical protein
MTLPVSGPIYLSQVNTELDKSSTAAIYLGDAAVRTLAEVPSGSIFMSNLYGKSNRRSISYVFSTTTANASLNLATLPNYAPGAADITITINGGVYLYATSTANAGLTLTNGTAGDTLNIVNNGFILGMGGSPSNFANVTTGPGTSAPQTANVGGPALSLSYPATINNTNASAYIAGGGGSGGGSWYWVTGYGGIYSLNCGGGGGAGGGVGGNAYNYDSAGNGVLGATGGSGGGAGSSGSNGAVGSGGTYGQQSGGGGGRVLPATDTTRSINTSQQSPGTFLPGLGGSGGGVGGLYGNAIPATGGGTTNFIASQTGGGGTNAGVTSYTSGTSAIAGSGGGWGASGSGGGLNSFVNNTGAAGGKAVALNGNSVTWVSGNTTRVYGAVS